MSIAMKSVVWQLAMPVDQKILLLKLADCANDQGRIPSQYSGELALMCCISVTLVQKILRDFVETGVLVVEISDSANGRTPVYRLDLTIAAALFPRIKRIPYRRKRRA